MKPTETDRNAVRAPGPPPAWRRVRGVIVPGHGVAAGGPDSPYPRGTIEMQTPFFTALGLDLRPYHPATLNVRIHPFAFAVVAPAHTFREVQWSPAHDPEDFSFSPCRLRPDGREWLDGLVYYPHPETEIDHPHDPSTLEILAPFVPEAGVGQRIDVALDEREISVS